MWGSIAATWECLMVMQISPWSFIAASIFSEVRIDKAFLIHESYESWKLFNHADQVLKIVKNAIETMCVRTQFSMKAQHDWAHQLNYSDNGKSDEQVWLVAKFSNKTGDCHCRYFLILFVLKHIALITFLTKYLLRASNSTSQTGTLPRHLQRYAWVQRIATLLCVGLGRRPVGTKTFHSTHCNYWTWGRCIMLVQKTYAFWVAYVNHIFVVRDNGCCIANLVIGGVVDLVEESAVLCF